MSSADVSDETLMLRYQRGERSALAELVRRHQSSVYNFMLRQLGSALAADEMAQQVFLGVVRDAVRFNYEAPFVARLFGIACRLARQERGRFQRLRAKVDGSPESGIPPPASRLEAASPRGWKAENPELEESIVRAVDALPDEQKDVFLLREVAELRFSEIASVTQQSESTVKMQMHQALQQLRAALQDFDEYRRVLRQGG